MLTSDLRELLEVERVIDSDRAAGNSALSDAIACLRDELICLYVTAEEIHWHLRLGRYERQSQLALFDQAEVARQLTGDLLGAIVRCVGIGEKASGQCDGDALLKTVLALRAENEALATSPAT